MKLIFNNPAIRLVPPGFDLVELVEPLVIQTPFGTHQVPAGFVCDLESVPRVVQALWPKLGRGAIPGTLHDALYRSGIITRPMADAAYLEALKDYGCGIFERWTKYLAVRAFGWQAWNEHRRKEVLGSERTD